MNCHGKHKHKATMTPYHSGLLREVLYRCSLCGEVTKDPENDIGPWCQGCEFIGFAHGIGICTKEDEDESEHNR